MIEISIAIAMAVLFAYLYTMHLIRPFLEIVGHGVVLSKDERKEARKREKAYRAFKREQRRL